MACLASLGLLVVEQQAVGGVWQDAAANQEDKSRGGCKTQRQAPAPLYVLNNCNHSALASAPCKMLQPSQSREEITDAFHHIKTTPACCGLVRWNIAAGIGRAYSN